MNAKVAIMVPVYKQEKYLCKSLDSFVNLVFKNQFKFL